MLKKILAIFVFFCAAAAAQSVGPVVTVPQINYDFTHVAQDSTLQHTFMIYNGGGAVLKMWNVRTSCKCITASLEKTTLAPTDSAALNVSYTNVGNSSHLDNYVTISTNDPNNPNLRIYITRAVPRTGPTLSEMPKDTIGGVANSPAPIIYFPVTEHNFGKMKQGTVASYTFKFMNKGNSTLRIRDITTSCGCTAALINQKNIAPGKEGKIRVDFDSSGKMGKLVRRVTVLSNDPNDVYKTLLIYADVEKE